MLDLLRRMRFRWEHKWTHEHLSEYLDGGLAHGDLERLERHVGRCPECRRVLTTLKRTLAGLMSLSGPESGEIADSVIARLRAEP